jgi:hypothetical protein
VERRLFFVQREPETGAIEGLYLSRPVHFWRPLYRAVVPALATVLWGQEPENHLISAVFHGANALLLWRLLLALGATRLAASLGALLFMVMPAAYEVVFWLCALPTSMSTMLVLLAMHLCVLQARGRARPWTPLLHPALAFAAASLNEQPACALAGLPVVYLAARANGGAGWKVLSRAAAPAVLAGTGLVAYITAQGLVMGPHAALGHEGFTVPARELPFEAARIAGWARMQFLSWDFASRALEVAARALGEHPARAGVLGLVLAAGAFFWARDQDERGRERVSGANSPGRSAAWIAALGVVLALAPWAPIAAFNYWLNSRVAYVPGMGIAVLAAGGLTALSRSGKRAVPGRWSMVVASLVTVALVLPALVMVGIQRAYQERHWRDLAEAEALRALVHHPPAGAVFVPARIAFRAESRGQERFDRLFWSAFGSDWSARWILRHEFRRSDLDCGFAYWNESGLRWARAGDVDVRGVGRTAWERIVPFEVDEHGAVHLVTEVEFEDGGGVLRVSVPLVAELLVPPRMFVIPP